MSLKVMPVFADEFEFLKAKAALCDEMANKAERQKERASTVFFILTTVTVPFAVYQTFGWLVLLWSIGILSFALFIESLCE